MTEKNKTKRGTGRGETEMICTKCGARLMETDQFCPKCGTKVIKEKRCLECGELLRDGARFCPGCGSAVGEKRRGQTTPKGMGDDIPIEAIERNILSETAAEIKAERRGQSVAPKKKTVRNESSGSTAASGRSAGGSSRADAPVRKKQSAVSEQPRRKRPVYQEEDDWDYEDDWDEDDWEDDEDEGMDAITVMTVVVGCILLIVVAFLGFHFYRQYVPKDYKGTSEQGEAQEQEERELPKQDGTENDAQEQTSEISGSVSKLTIESNVNVRDQPSTSGTNVLKVAKAGETYVCNGFTEDKAWYEIVLEDGTIGYVFHEYISIE